jgi:hypothetical protein
VAMSGKLIILLFFSIALFGQDKETSSFVDVNYFYGTILRHNKDISHLVKGHPEGLILSYNRKTFGDKRWQQTYNYPDWGFSFLYQNPHNSILGQNYGLHGHYNFYFFKRNLLFRVGSGVSYNTNPFDLDTNFKNNAYGSHILNSTYFLINYSKKNIFKGFGLQAGLTLIHYSNANVRAPNSSTNTVALNIGMQYELDQKESPTLFKKNTYEKYSEPIKFNFMVRGGVNESDFIGLGQHPFWIVSSYLDKRLSYLSSIQFGAEVFFAEFLKKQIEYVAVSFPNFGTNGNADTTRVGFFVGHELHLNKLGILTQLGYYAYYPSEFESRVYIRAGLNYYFHKNIFGSVTLKSHGAKVEAVEFGLGIRI